MRLNSFQFITASLFVALLISSATAQTTPEKVTLEELRFLVGFWQSALVDGVTSRGLIDAPENGIIMGTFSHKRDNVTIFSETLFIEQTSSGPVLNWNYFCHNKNAKADEFCFADKPKFDVSYDLRLVQFIKDKATFETKDKAVRLVLHKTSNNRLSVVSEKTKNGSTFIHQLFYEH